MTVQTEGEGGAVGWRRWRAAVLGGGLAILIGGLVWWAAHLLSKPSDTKKKRVVQEISLMKPPPPPPPKVEPPKIQPPKQPEIEQKVDVPKAAPSEKPPDAPPPGPDLGLDAKGTGTGDSFGLVAKKGGADLLIGGAGQGGGNRFAWYGVLLKDSLLEAVMREKKVREASDYRVNVNVWVSGTGVVTKVEFVGASNFPEIDEAVKLALQNTPAIREGAPVDMPQPVRLRITAR